MTQEYSRDTILLCYMGTHWRFLKMQHLLIILTSNHLMIAANWFSFCNQQVVKHSTGTLLLFNISTTVNISTTLILTVACYYPAIMLLTHHFHCTYHQVYLFVLHWQHLCEWLLTLTGWGCALTIKASPMKNCTVILF